MKTKTFLSTLLIALVLAAFLLGGIPSTVFAARYVPPPTPTVMVIPSPKPFQLGEPIQIYAQLRDSNNNVLSDLPVDFFIDYNYVGQGRSDPNGVTSFQTKKNLAAGDHLLSARFSGAKNLLPSSLSRKLTILPAIVTVQTVPALAGVTFNMDSRDFVSGPDGIAKIAISQVGKYTLSVDTSKYSSPDTRIEFGRWETESYLPSRDVFVPTDSPILAGINVFHRIGQTFVDLDGNPVDMSRVSKITIKSIQGDVFSNPDGALTWVPASRVARLENGLQVTQLQYSVMNVTVDGSNVVNQAQQRFYIKPDDVWKIQLLLYSAKITATDAIFGTPVGKEVRVEFPDGEAHIYTLDSTGSVEINSLARGIYHIQVSGVKGMISPTPVALSRNQVVAMKVITNQDMTLAGGVGAAVAIGLILIGRPWLLLPGLRRKRHHQDDDELEAQAEGYVSIHNN